MADINETFVLERWEKVENHGTRRHPIPILNGVECKLPLHLWDDGWIAAAEFTRERIVEIAQVEEEIEALKDHLSARECYEQKWYRILDREQAALDKLRRGMK